VILQFLVLRKKQSGISLKAMKGKGCVMMVKKATVTIELNEGEQNQLKIALLVVAELANDAIRDEKDNPIFIRNGIDLMNDRAYVNIKEFCDRLIYAMS